MDRLFVESARRIHAEFGFGKLRFFVMKYIQFLPHSARWLRFIDAYHRRHTGQAAPVEMLRTKFMRSYYSRRLGPGRRLRQLRDHFDLAEAWLEAAILARLLDGETQTLAEIRGKDGEAFTFTLGRHDRYRAEGELTLFMHQAGYDPALAALTFALGRDGLDRTVVRIGGLQGPQSDDSRDRIVEATKALHGLRPKAAVVQALYAFTETLGPVAVEAVGKANHPLHNDRHAFFADNDAFWPELGGQRNPHGDWVLPVPLPERRAEDVLAKRRKSWLARQACRVTLRNAVLATVEPWLRHPPEAARAAG